MRTSLFTKTSLILNVILLCVIIYTFDIEQIKDISNEVDVKVQISSSSSPTLSPSTHLPSRSFQNKIQERWNPFNDTNPHSKSWCPFAKCYNSPLCTPCNRRHLLIIATGRSGSTSLLKMMNYLPGVRLSGENMNELFEAFQLEKNLKGSKHHNILSNENEITEGAFIHNSIPRNSMACAIQHITSVINPPPKYIQEHDNIRSIRKYDSNTIMGLKTIRFHQGYWSVKDATEFLQRNFPCSRILINVRSDFESQSLSLTSNLNIKKGKEKEKLKQANEFLKNLANSLGEDMSRLLDMDEWANDVKIINEILVWLGFKDCAFNSTLHENINGYERDRSAVILGNNCRYAHDII